MGTQGLIWLTKWGRIKRSMDENPEVKNHTTFHYVGKSLLRADSRLKVTGEAVYTADVPMRERGYANVLRPPSHRVGLKTVDYSEAEKMTGVQVVREGDLIAVLHESHDVTERALGTIKAIYSADV